MPREPFLRLIEANRRDQELVAYQTFDELVEYCTLSADPVGELVLHIFGVATADRIALSNRVCTALQLAEHWQDVGEDFRNGRVYLPAEDLERFGVSTSDLGAARTGRPLRQLLAFEVARAQELLEGGGGLVGRVHGPGADRDRRLRRRRPRCPRRDRRRRLRRAPGRAQGRSGTTGSRHDPHLPAGLMTGATALTPAYEHCRSVARESGSSFYSGMRLLPPERRAALFAVYALARRIDDIADGDLPAADKLRALEQERDFVDRAAGSDDPVLVAVADAAKRFPIPLDAFGDLIDGAELDVRGPRS